MKKSNRLSMHIRTKWIFISTCFLSLSIPTFLHASFLGPLALLSLPTGIQSLISMKQFAKIKKELVKLLPHIALLLIVLSLVLLLLFSIILIIYVRKMYRTMHRKRMKHYSQLLHSLLLELSLKKEIEHSLFLEKLRENIKQPAFRKTLGTQSSNLVDEALQALLSKKISTDDQEHIIMNLIYLIGTRIIHYS